MVVVTRQRSRPADERTLDAFNTSDDLMNCSRSAMLQAASAAPAETSWGRKTYQNLDVPAVQQGLLITVFIDSPVPLISANKRQHPKPDQLHKHPSQND